MRFKKRRRRVPVRDSDGRPAGVATWKEAAPDGATEPRGVRIRHADGRVTDCAIIRDPQDDEDGLAQWMAVAPDGTVFTPPGDAVTVEFLPARSAIRLVLPMQP
jgi:hypothetical protein